MSNVLPFAPRPKPKHKLNRDSEVLDPSQPLTCQGAATCLSCKHKFEATVPAGSQWFECPECHTEHALFDYACYPPDETPLWVCNCGNHLFILTDVGHMCPNCGVYISYD